jgi:predicted nucleic acid-binding protein
LISSLVIDASVVVQACLAADGFEALRSYRLIGPTLVASEALSALHEALYRGELSAALVRGARERLATAPIELLAPEGLATAAWDIADRLGWAKTHDAEYVALAGLMKCRLLTIDARLARGAGQIVEIIGPADI